MTGERILGVTVDLDDTIFPQASWLSGAWSAVATRAAHVGLDGDALHRELRRIAAEGSDRGRIIDRALASCGQPVDPWLPELVAAFTEHAPARLEGYPGALDALDRIRRVVPTVVVTDGNPGIQRGKVSALGLAGAIPLVVSDELGGRHRRKPDGAPFRRALEILGLDPRHVVHVGDRPDKDVAGAHGVGMRAVRVRTGEYASGDDPNVRPWRETGSFAEAVDLLLAATGAGTPWALSRL